MHSDCTTKRCTHCGETKPLDAFQKNRTTPDGLQYWCSACRRERAQDPERKTIKQSYDRERRDRLGETLLEQKRIYQRRPDIKERRKAYDESRRYDPKRLEYERARYYRRAADPAYRAAIVAYHRNRRQTDIGYRQRVRLYQRRRKQRIEIQGTPFTKAEWNELCERYGHRCLACGSTASLTVDHIVPLAHGGSSGIENIQPLCLDCNRKKNARTIDFRPLKQSTMEL